MDTISRYSANNSHFDAIIYKNWQKQIMREAHGVVHAQICTHTHTVDNDTQLYLAAFNTCQEWKGEEGHGTFPLH